MAHDITVEQAEDFIQGIRLSKGVDDPNGLNHPNVRDLNNSLELLAEQLYSKPTHFLLELIQNADDNSYRSETPTITFETYESADGALMRIDCNEIGFSKENVKAICSIGQSTKTRRDRGRGFIGEKGIGFKSVFKVADVAHISSGPFQFKLDRRQILGMIAPILEGFPRAEYELHETQILLSLKSNAELQQINDDLHTLKPQLLLFLRKLWKIHIRTTSLASVYTKTVDIQDPDLHGEVAKLSSTAHGNRSVRVSTGYRKYLIVRHIVSNLPEEARRPEIQESEIVLAFPLESDTSPKIKNQSVYAYLPINDFGFSYLIQADFLLTANRENIETELSWNVSLGNGIVDAFRKAVDRFNAVTISPGWGLKYTWPSFLKRGDFPAPFWSNVKQKIVEKLKAATILQSQDSNAGLRRPDTLSYIPPEFRLDGLPLLERQDMKSRYLSFNYNGDIPELMPELRLIGVRSMSGQDFVDEFQSCLHDGGAEFLNMQSTAWHERVGELLHRYTSPGRLENLAIIPLQEGGWACPADRDIYLNHDTMSLDIPRGINIRLVNFEVSSNYHRRIFFQWLGITVCDQARVCSLVLERHLDRRSIISRSLPDLVTDAFYLFQTPRRSFDPPLHGFCLADTDSVVRYGSHLYVEQPGRRSPVAWCARVPRSGIRFLHQAYFEKARNENTETEFIKWLIKYVKVLTLPSLVRHGELTTEFNFLTTIVNIWELLIILKDNWTHYKDQMSIYVSSPSPSGGRQRSQLSSIISTTRICQRQDSFPFLGQTVIALESLKALGPHLPFINVPAPDDPGWQVLSTFGVIVAETMELHLRELEALAQSNDPTTVLEVGRIYGHISRLYSTTHDRTRIRDAFSRQSLVYQPREQRWVSTRNCVWDAPPCLTRVFALATIYSNCRRLFFNCLNVRNATIDDVVDELANLVPSQNFDRHKDLLLALNQYLIVGASSRSLRDLRGIPAIPVSWGDAGTHLVSYDAGNWYIADRSSLRESFVGRVYFIDFGIAVVNTLKPLIEAMGLEDRLLSKSVIEWTESSGHAVLDTDWTEFVKCRAQYFTRLVPSELRNITHEFENLMTRLRTLTVLASPSIKLKRRVGQIEGRETTGDVVFQDTDTTLTIYVLIDADQAMVKSCLSDVFAKHCRITDPTHAMLVLKILNIPIARIEGLLEHIADASEDSQLDRSFLTPFSNHSGSQDEEERAGSPPGLGTPVEPDHGRNPDPFIASAPDFNSRPMPALRARIPTLDRSLTEIREAAARHLSGTNLAEQPGFGAPVHFAGRVPNSNNGRVSHDDSTLERSHLGSPSPIPHRSPGRPLPDVFNTGIFREALPETNAVDLPGQVPSPGIRRLPYTSTRQEGNSAPSLRQRHIGLLGELFIDEVFNRVLPDWNEINWTSRNRVEAGRAPFRQLERDFADFTYADSTGDMTRFLVDGGFTEAENWLLNFDNPPTYHLEVKATTQGCNAPFFMSNNQVEKARAYTIRGAEVPRDVYVVLRVYDLDNADRLPGYAIYLDPWNMYLDRALDFTSWDHYVVTPSRNFNARV